MLKKFYEFGLKQVEKGEDRLASLHEFVDYFEIDWLIDIRYNRGNRYINWKCNGTNLEKEFGSQYVWIREMGIPPQIRKQFKNSPMEAKQWYLKRLQIIDARKLVAPYIQGNDKCAFLCVENVNDPKTRHCHRFWAIEDLENGS